MARGVGQTQKGQLLPVSPSGLGPTSLEQPVAVVCLDMHIHALPCCRQRRDYFKSVFSVSVGSSKTLAIELWTVVKLEEGTHTFSDLKSKLFLLQGLPSN